MTLRRHSNIEITDRVQRFVEPVQDYYLASEVDAAKPDQLAPSLPPQQEKPELGDWVQDWSGNLFIWQTKHANELEKYPVAHKYLSQIRRADGRVWVREGRSPLTGAQLRRKVNP